MWYKLFIVYMDRAMKRITSVLLSIPTIYWLESTTKIVQTVALSWKYGTNSSVSKGLLFSHTYAHPCRQTVMVVNTKPGNSPLFQPEIRDYSTTLRFSIMVIHIYFIGSAFLIQPCIPPSISVSCRRWDKHMKRKKVSQLCINCAEL